MSGERRHYNVQGRSAATRGTKARQTTAAKGSVQQRRAVTQLATEAAATCHNSGMQQRRDAAAATLNPPTRRRKPRMRRDGRNRGREVDVTSSKAVVEPTDATLNGWAAQRW